MVASTFAKDQMEDRRSLLIIRLTEIIQIRTGMLPIRNWVTMGFPGLVITANGSTRAAGLLSLTSLGVEG